MVEYAHEHLTNWKYNCTKVYQKQFSKILKCNAILLVHLSRKALIELHPPAILLELIRGL